ncbi:MAG TPA: hypothetical protein VJI96_00635 [Candidatus Andersenbacteria bacterium]|nr:hypothetical protein [Candidatus Andersenbacteria bacterium]
MTDFTGVIIEESLADTSILDELNITDTKFEQVTRDHATPWLQQWTLHEVTVPEINIEAIAQKISQSLDPEHGASWYADFKNDSTHYIIFLNKVFKIDRSKPEQYKAATDYGISIGIPAYQVDFSPHIKEWKR